MDRTQIDSQHFLTRYLAGELSADDEAQFEAYAENNPDVYREIEIVLRMKEGFATLQDRNQLQPLLAERRAPPIGFAAAAAVAVLAVGMWVWHEFAQPAVNLLARTPAEFSSSQNQPAPTTGTYVLIRTRDVAAPLRLTLPLAHGVIELRIMPSLYDARTSYEAAMARANGIGDQVTVGEVHGLTVGADRYVKVYLDTTRLLRGDYDLSLTTRTSGSADKVVEHFPVQVR